MEPDERFAWLEGELKPYPPLMIREWELWAAKWRDDPPSGLPLGKFEAVELEPGDA